MSSKALLTDSLFKKYIRRTGYIKWEDEQMLRRHQQRVRMMKPAIDNKSPNLTPFMALNKKRAQLEEDRLHEIEMKNFALLRRLQAIGKRRPATFCHRRRKALMRGDAYYLEKPSGKRIWRYDWQSLQGSTMRKSLRLQEEVLQRLVSLKMVDTKEEKWLQKWMPRVKDIPVDMLSYSQSTYRTDSNIELSMQQQDAEPDSDYYPADIIARTAKLSLGTDSSDMKTRPSDVDTKVVYVSPTTNDTIDLLSEK
ncbi:hypothetical protein O6H91_05G012300 [Diphasiastrum complanatum]|uniref:Uncharacterized protein n=1 Tax=Diphasiastrum complanatum TaxID=34168 RepID=A0ACC2DLF5_DIPCM|nr:hypothetical protein O6H91_05G012300 [Diphasiastrum complanatum]